jgi:hypothetical protein
MPRLDWPLRNGRPCIEIVLTLLPNGQPQPRTLVADTGAGSFHAGFELILEEDDCLLCGGIVVGTGLLRGAYVGAFPFYDLAVQIPGLNFTRNLRVVGVPSVPPNCNGIAGFRFLNRFHYGNFGDPSHFSLEA